MAQINTLYIKENNSKGIEMVTLGYAPIGKLYYEEEVNRDEYTSHTETFEDVIQEDGFMRACGKYSHEVFPFDYFIANSWVMGNPPTKEKASPHGKVFQELAEQLKTADVS